MPSFEVITCDVFTTAPFGGNPLAVFPDASGVDGADMQRIARELNLSETVFVLPPDDEAALRRLRIFTPGTELPIAGHPVVGTWFVMATLGIVPPPAGGSGSVRVQQQLNVGLLPVDIEFSGGAPSRVAMTQPRPTLGEPLAVAAEAAAALGLSPGDVARDDALPILTISAGSPFLLVPLATREALARCRPDLAALDAVVQRAGALGVYAVFRETATLVHARMFGGTRLAIAEDPATGSAAGPLAGALLRFGALPSDAPRFVVEQGADMGRPGRIEVDAVVAGTEIEAVRVAGASVILIRGAMSW